MKTNLLIGDQKTLFYGSNAVIGFSGERKAINTLTIITYEMSMGVVRFRMCFIIDVDGIQPVTLFVRDLMYNLLLAKMIQCTVQSDLINMLTIQSFSNISMREGYPGVKQYSKYLHPDRCHLQAMPSEYISDGFSVHDCKDMLNATELQVLQRPTQK